MSITLRDASRLLPTLKTYLASNQLVLAVTLADQIASCRPTARNVLETLAGVYLEAVEPSKAQRYIEKLIANYGEYGYGMFLLARLAFELKEYTMAYSCLNKAEELGVDEADRCLFYSLRAQVLVKSGNPGQAASDYYKAYEYSVDMVTKCINYSNYLLNMHYLPIDRLKIYEASCRYEDILAGIEPFLDHKYDRRHKKIRIGYVSGDIHRHIMAQFIRPFLADYDKASFEVFVYSFGVRDDVTELYRDMTGEGWRDINGMAYEDIASQIHNDEIDILVDLGGHSSGGLLPVFAYKPAPIQVSGVGYFSTTGLSVMDYFIGDQYTFTKENTQFFSEEPIVLPNSHFCYQPLQSFELSDRYQKEKKGTVFGSFNNIAKITDNVLITWKKILTKVDNSSLYVKNSAFADAGVQEAFLNRCENIGINRDSISIEAGSGDYMQCYGKMDIALDTFPYGGGGTTCDALYMGVPVISLLGKSHHERFGYSLLSNVGIAELCCAKTIGEYIKIAVVLANNRQYLKSLEKTITENMSKSCLGNSRMYMLDIENAYRYVWAKYLNSHA